MGKVLIPGSTATVERKAEKVESLSSSASVFRVWVDENPPTDPVLLRFVKDLLRMSEICDENFEKILGRMKYVDEFTAKFVSSIQGRMDDVEKYGVLIDRLVCRIRALEGSNGGLDEKAQGSASNCEAGRSGISEVAKEPVGGGDESGADTGGNASASEL